MANRESTETNEAQLAVHWKEEEYYYPSAQFIAQANMTDPNILERFGEKNFPECYKEYADMLTWYKYWEKTLDTSHPPFWKWFVGGEINACYNCVDRHLPKHRNKTAIHFVPELETEAIQHVTYQELYVRVNEFAALLRDYCGLKRGDRVTLHLPMVAELPITMLACARLGVIHSQVFAGFSGNACGERIEDSQSRFLITMDGYYRSGKLLDHKKQANIAYETAHKLGKPPEKVLIWQRHPGKYSAETPLVEGRDFIINDLLPKYRGHRIEPERMKAEDILFLMYTSGTTGRPKAAQHSTGGYLAYVTGTSKYIQDIHPEDVYWCMADIGWITGHSYIVYGPLALAASSVVYEGIPTYPDAGRPWRIAEELGVNIFHTSPTAIRGLRKAGEDVPRKYNHHFKHMTTVGEPIEPAVWHWYYNEVGKKEAVIVDTWWQTENGGFLCSTVPALAPMKPGSCGPGVPGIYPIVFDDDGKELPAGIGKAGNICIRNPWPGSMQTIWGDHDRFVKVYYERYCKNKDSKDWRDWPYMAGDGAVLAADGYVRILGRIDDVINVAGHRLGTKELESAALTVEEVAEAAVVPIPDEVKGKVPELYVSLKPGYKPTKELQDKIAKALSDAISPIARPKHSNTGDVTTLANPKVVETIRVMVQGEGK
jgi:acetyl-CoA synthetase